MTDQPAADGDLREVTVPVATVWTSPDAPRALDEPVVRDTVDPQGWTAAMDARDRLELHGRTLTQLLLGEPAVVIESRGDWSRIVAPQQTSSADARGYPGWVRTAHLAAPAQRLTHQVARVVTPTTCEVLDDAAATMSLSSGTTLAVDRDVDVADEQSMHVLLPGGRRGLLPRADVRVTLSGSEDDWAPDDVLGAARGFLGLRYLWGGTSAWGLDCSGLVYLAYRLHGRLVPRDAFDQASAAGLEPVPLDRVRPGDLYFFARAGARIHHVGFATSAVERDGTRRMLHAPEGGGLIEDVVMPAERQSLLVAAGRFSPR